MMTKEQIENFPAGRDLDALIMERVFGWNMPEPYFVSKEYHGDVFRLINHIAKTHWWLIKSPFEKNEMWFAGITPHSTSGWNGRPDFIGNGSTMALAVCRAALMMRFGHLT